VAVLNRDRITISFEFWGLLFVLSKALELGDTVFIVLRKQPLIFLHWYHHTTVLCYTWYTYAASPSTSPTFGAMNYVVHSLMYSYYALKVTSFGRSCISFFFCSWTLNFEIDLYCISQTIRFPVPRKVSMLITILQLAQMVLGIGVNVYSAYAKFILGSNCNVPTEHVFLALLMYSSYLALFGKFFYESYFSHLKSKVE